jgi:hypothetical protein
MILISDASLSAIKKFWEADFLKLIGHTFIFIVWAFIGVVAYDAYRTVADGKPLMEASMSRVVLSGIHFESFIKTQEQIGDLLQDLRAQSGASRAVLVLFTNGKASVGGVPFIHASAYAESHGPDLEPSLPRMQDLDIGFIPRLDVTLAGETYAYAADDSTHSMRRMCDCASILRGPIIRTFDGKPHGYIFITWDDDKTLADRDAGTLKQKINEFSFIFAGILSTVDIERLIREYEGGRG